MIWIIAVMILVVNEYATDKGWSRGVVRGLMALGLLAAAAVKLPGEMLLLSLCALSALTAGELWLCDERRRAPKPDRSSKRAEALAQELLLRDLHCDCKAITARRAIETRTRTPETEEKTA